jgi:FkbM family methyltransferase
MTGQFVSHAQHGEDVVIWRALGQVEDGVYVDVGAADPVIDSVTLSLYERGWHGIHVEAFEHYASRLRAARPRDVVVQTAAGAEAGSITFYAVPETGLSTVDPEQADALRAQGWSVRPTTLPVRTLDDILGEHLPQGQEIHVLKIDVEGAEERVLSGTDLARWRPWIVVVEATRPNSTERTDQLWNHHLVAAGYVPCMFDGLNQWFRRGDRDDLDQPLSYPACPLDDYSRVQGRDPSSQSLNELTAAYAATSMALAASRGTQRAAEKQRDLLVRDLARSQRNLKQITGSVWWRATRPARALIRRAKRLVRGAATIVSPPKPSPTVSGPLGPLGRDVLLQRLRVLLAAGAPGTTPQDLGGALELLRQPLLGPERDTWLWALHVAWTGTLPDDFRVENLVGLIDLDGVDSVLAELDRLSSLARAGWQREAALEVVAGVALDVTHTAMSNLHTGIQRVVRETVSRWKSKHEVTLLVLDPREHSYRHPTEDERDRVLGWSGSVGSESAPPAAGPILLPWRCRLVIPELPAAILRADLLRGAAQYSGGRVSVLAYDMTPITRAENAPDQLPSGFARYLSVVKHADRVSAISHTVADEFDAFGRMLAGQGLTGPEVRPQLLPTAARLMSDQDVARHEATVLGVARLPMVLSVSSIEPRKNHLRTLEAAERAWAEGLSFQLVFIAGNGWKRESFDHAVAQLQKRGRPIRVLSRADDETLWAAYRLARCSVFVSLVEGYGLPAAESLAVGTPVVLSRHGSMAEIAADGGTIPVDPRNPDEIAAAIRTMLTDEDAYERLRREARDRPPTSWDEYAADTWAWLVDGVEPGSA